jgi:hypothetical protein
MGEVHIYGIIVNALLGLLYTIRLFLEPHHVGIGNPHPMLIVNWGTNHQISSILLQAHTLSG